MSDKTEHKHAWNEWQSGWVDIRNQDQPQTAMIRQCRTCAVNEISLLGDFGIDTFQALPESTDENGDFQGKVV